MSRRQLINIDLFDMMKESAINNTDYYHLTPMAYDEEELHYSDIKRLLCPQYIHIDELCQMELMKELAFWKNDTNNTTDDNDITYAVMENSIDEFFKFNYA